MFNATARVLVTVRLIAKYDMHPKRLARMRKGRFISTSAVLSTTFLSGTLTWNHYLRLNACALDVAICSCVWLDNGRTVVSGPGTGNIHCRGFVYFIASLMIFGDVRVFQFGIGPSRNSVA